jgi:glyoxylate reductase
MTQSCPQVIVTRRLPAAVEARMEALFDVRLNRDDEAFDREALLQAVGACDVLVPTLTDRIDAALTEAAGDRLKLIASFGAGTDHIDLAAAKARGIAVTNTPGALTEDTADLIMALILGVPRGFGEGERILRAGKWTGWAPTNLLGRSLGGKALAIVGMGRIGKAVARRARACGMEIHYHNRSPVPEAEEQTLGARYWSDLDAMLAQADIVSLCCPYTPETHHLIDRRRFALLKRQAVLINAARAGVVEQEAMIEALETGRLAGVGLDVYPDEPEVDPRLVALPNAMLLPHLGSASIETRTAMGERIVANILAWQAGEELPDRVV